MSLDCVACGEVAKAAPSEVESVVVVGNVNRSQIPTLIDKEVNDVESVENGDKNEGWLDAPVVLVYVRDVGKITVCGSTEFV